MVREGEFVELALQSTGRLVRGYVYSKGRGYDMGIEPFEGDIVHTNGAEDIIKGTVRSLVWSEDTRYGDESVGVLTPLEQFQHLIRSLLQGGWERRYNVGRLSPHDLFEVGDFYKHDGRHQKGEGIGWERLEGAPGGKPEGFAFYPRLFYVAHDSLEDRKFKVTITRDSERREGATGYSELDYEWLNTWSVHVESDNRRSYDLVNATEMNAHDAVVHLSQAIELVREMAGEGAQLGYDYGQAEGKRKVEKAVREMKATLTKAMGELKLDD